MYDVIIIGAGVGGLSCAAKLAKNRKKILILEKIPHNEFLSWHKYAIIPLS